MLYLRYEEQDEAKYILDEVLEDIYKDQSVARSLIGKIARAGVDTAFCTLYDSCPHSPMI